MFPRMRQRLGSALRDNLDLMVEFSTLGEYRLMDPGAADPRTPAGQAPTEPAARSPLPTGPTMRPAGAGPAGRRPCVGQPATAAARALTRRQRAGAPEPPEQVCVSR
jgi:hypothetical protein